MKSKLDAFMNEEVKFDEPQGHLGFSVSIAIMCSNNQATKTVTRTYNMPNGATIKKTVSVSKTL